MQQKTLGQVKTPISALGYGAMSFSDFYGPTDDDKSNAILDRCRDLGITHIDTSNVYGMGMSEKRIGAYLARQGKQAQDFFTIATKAAIASKPDGTPKKQLDVSRLKALGWSAQIPLNQGLPMAFEDFKHAQAAQLIRQR